MFRPVVAIIRSLSFDTLKSTLYNCVAACLVRSQHQNLFEFDISILGVWVSHSVNLKVWSYNTKKLRKSTKKTKKTKQKLRGACWSCHGESGMCCPHVGLAYCFLLHLCRLLCVEGLYVTWLMLVSGASVYLVYLMLLRT